MKRTKQNSGHGRATGASVDGSVLKCRFEDGVEVCASLSKLGISSSPKIVAAEPDEFGSGVVLHRADGTNEDIGADFVLIASAADYDSGLTRNVRDDLKSRASANLRRAREGAGRTQSWMASRLKMAVPNYSRLESGRHMIDLEILVRASEILQIKLDELIGARAAPSSSAGKVLSTLQMAIFAAGSRLVLREPVQIEGEIPAGVTVTYTDRGIHFAAAEEADDVAKPKRKSAGR